jgi:hypothetical protein
VQSSATQYDGIVTLEDTAYQSKLKSSAAVSRSLHFISIFCKLTEDNPVHLVMLPTELCVSGNKFTQDHQVYVQNERCRTIFSSQNEMETTVNSSEDQLFERVIQNEECLTQPIETISPKQSAANNCKNNKKYPDTFKLDDLE